MTTIASQITSLMVVYSTVYSDAKQRKHQSSASLAFVWGIHRDRWIPRTKGQLRGKCFHLMTSSCWANVDSDRCRHMAALSHNDLTPLYMARMMELIQIATLNMFEKSMALQLHNLGLLFDRLNIMPPDRYKPLLHRSCWHHYWHHLLHMNQYGWIQISTDMPTFIFARTCGIDG